MSFSVGLYSDGPNVSEVNFQQGGRITSNYTRTYLYKTDVGTRPTDAAIVTDIGIDPGSPHPGDSNATCHRVEIGPGPERTRPPHLAYLVKVDWSTLAPLPNTVSTDPTTMRTQWSIAPNIQQRAIIRDSSGSLILNAAKQPFDGGIPVAVRLGTAVAKRNVTASGYNQNTVMANSGKVNSATYLGAPAGTLQVDISATEKFEGGYHYWEETYTFSYDPLGWQPRPLNAGYHLLRDGKVERIRNKDVEPTTLIDPAGYVQEPQPLLTSGAIVPIADRPTLCNFVTVSYFGTMDFSTFGL